MLAQYFHSMTDEGEASGSRWCGSGWASGREHLPSELSGRRAMQRVCIARALINNSPILAGGMSLRAI